jgi:RNA polymerase sigma-70 factor (ECF subfamily)
VASEKSTTLKTERDIIEGCRTGDNSARKALYTLYAERMLAVCYRYIGDTDVAHDVLHDGFIKIFTHFTFRGECALETWLTRVMMTGAIDYLRREKRMNILPMDSGDLPEVTDNESGYFEEMSHRAEQELSEEELMKLVATLPDGCRAVFNLYVFEEKSHKEIATLLGIKEHTSTSQLHRAKKWLAQRIKEYNQ